MGVIDNIAQRTYSAQQGSYSSMPNTQPMNAQGFNVSGAASAGVGTPGSGFAMTLLVVLAGVLLAYAATRRIQGA